MSNADYREPTNDELWAQPPMTAQHTVASQSMVPSTHAPVPAPVPAAPLPVASSRPDRTPFVLAIVSIALGIPLTAIASQEGGLFGLLIAWIGIVAVNFIYDRTRRH